MTRRKNAPAAFLFLASKNLEANLPLHAYFLRGVPGISDEERASWLVPRDIDSRTMKRLKLLIGDSGAVGTMGAIVGSPSQSYREGLTGQQINILSATVRRGGAFSSKMINTFFDIAECPDPLCPDILSEGVRKGRDLLADAWRELEAEKSEEVYTEAKKILATRPNSKRGDTFFRAASFDFECASLTWLGRKFDRLEALAEIGRVPAVIYAMVHPNFALPNPRYLREDGVVAYTNTSNEVYRALVGTAFVEEGTRTEPPSRTVVKMTEKTAPLDSRNSNQLKTDLENSIFGRNTIPYSLDTRARVHFFAEDVVGRYNLSRDDVKSLASAFSIFNLHRRVTHDKKRPESDLHLRNFFDDITLRYHRGEGSPSPRELEEMYIHAKPSASRDRRGQILQTV